MERSQKEKEELKNAVREGIIEALKSQEAQDAVLGAVGAWFDRQSGKAVKKLFAAVAIVVVIKIASTPEIFKSWITSIGK